MNNNFRGWDAVFGFTFRQATKGISFKLVTILISILIMGAFVVLNIIIAKPEEKDAAQASPVKAIFVLDDSGLQPTDFKAYNPELSGERFQNITFTNVTGMNRLDVIQKAAADGAESIAVIITATSEGYELEAVIPSGSSITKEQAQAVLAPMKVSFESSKLMQSGLSGEQLTTVLKPVATSYSDIGETQSVIAFVVRMIAPMVFGFVLYMMLILYGQTVSKSVSIEKTSKLVETLLTSIHPYALITGKVLAATTMAVMQFVIWIASGIIGLYGGSLVAQQLYPEYKNSVITIVQFLRDNIGETAMTIPSVILAIIVFCIGFLFYCVISGMAGCMVSKPEDTSTTQTLFVFPILISWLVCYLAPVMGNETLTAVIRYIPFTIPFCIPSEMITGTIGYVQGLISLLILAAGSLLVIMLSARIYKGLILYTGEKINLKLIGNIIKANK
ncbi:MAG TPA: ABC transporter permease [Clostridiales bacterium]|nr:ABC transporter permease [Clostridiales bacterium]